jgi:hypothetical protein
MRLRQSPSSAAKRPAHFLCANRQSALEGVIGPDSSHGDKKFVNYQIIVSRAQKTWYNSV